MANNLPVLREQLDVLPKPRTGVKAVTPRGKQLGSLVALMARSKNGAAYFEDASISELVAGESQTQAPRAGFARMKARTRGPCQHPGMDSPRLRRKRKTLQPPAINVLSKEGIHQVDYQVNHQSYLIEEGSPRSHTAQIPLSISTSARKVRLRVQPSDGSEPNKESANKKSFMGCGKLPISTKDMVDLDRQEEALQELLMQQAQWKIQAKHMEDGTNKRLVLLKGHQPQKPIKWMNTRRAAKNAEVLMFTSMNEMLMNEVEEGFPKSEINAGVS